MAKGKATAQNKKVVFGKRKEGKAKKRANKHETTKVYRGQGK